MKGAGRSDGIIGGPDLYKTSLYGFGVMAALMSSTALAQEVGTLRFSTEFEVTQNSLDDPFDLGTLVLDFDNLQRPVDEVSAAVSVVSGEVASQPTNPDLTEAISDLPNVDYRTGEFLPNIRGIDGSAGQFGAGAFSTGTRPRVNVIADGVSRQTSLLGNSASQLSAWDVDRIEVARGPQTTSGGRSSLGGAINVIYNDPVFSDEFALRGTLETREGELQYGSSLMANTVLVEDQLALRFTLDGKIGDTFIDITDPAFAAVRGELEEEYDYTGRLQLLARPAATPGLELEFSYERMRRNQLSRNYVDPGSTDFTDSDFAEQTDETTTVDTFVLSASYDLSPNWTVDGFLSYSEGEFVILPNAASTLDLTQDVETLQAEVRANYVGDGFLRRLTFGLNYEESEELAINNPALFDLSSSGDLTSRSIFAEAEFALSERLFFEVGGRYEEEKNDRGVLIFGTGLDASLGDEFFTPRVGLRYQVSDLTTIGYLYSEGVRSGGVAIDFGLFGNPPGTVNFFDEERLRQHEVWLRHGSADGRLDVTAAAFFYTLDDAQEGGAGPGDLTGNVPEAEGYGLELTASYVVNDQLRLSGSLGLLDTEVTDVGTDPEIAGFLGASLPGTANVNLGFGLDYQVNDRLSLGTRISYVGDRAGGFGGNDASSYTLVDLQANYLMPLRNGNELEITGYITNALDDVVRFSEDPSFGDTVGAPRTLGIAATMRF